MANARVYMFRAREEATEAVVPVQKKAKTDESKREDVIAEYVLNMYESESFLDVTLKCHDGNVKAHRCILAAASPVFAVILGGEMKEATMRTVELSNTSVTTARAFIAFIYTGIVTTYKSLGDLLRMAYKFECEALIQYTAFKLLEEASVENVVDTCAAMRLFLDHEVIRNCFYALQNKIQENPSLIVTLMLDLDRFRSCRS